MAEEHKYSDPVAETARRLLLGESAEESPPPGQPMHPRDRSLFVVLAWLAIPAGMVVAGFVAIFSGAPHWGAACIVLGLLTMSVATLYVLEKKPKTLSPPHLALALIVAAVLTWVFIGWQTWVALHPTTQGYTQAQLDQSVANGKAPIQSKLDEVTRQNSALRQQLDAAQRQIAGLRPQNKTPPTLSPGPQETLSKEDIAIKIEIWQSIGRQMNDLIATLNNGYVLLDTWTVSVRSNRSKFLDTLEAYRKSVQQIKNELDNLRVSYLNYPDVSAALDEVKYVRSAIPVTIFDKLNYSASGFWRAIHDLPEPISQDFETRMRIFAGAMRRDTNSLRDWQQSLSKTAALRSSELSGLRTK